MKNSLNNLFIYREKEQDFGWNVTHSPIILLIITFLYMFIIGGISENFFPRSLVHFYFMVPGFLAIVVAIILDQRSMRAVCTSDRDLIFFAIRNERRMVRTAGTMLVVMAIFMIVYLWLVFS